MRRRAALFVVLVVSLVAACKRSPTVGPASAETLAPVPPPEGLLAEVMISRPDRTWEAVRATLGTANALVPSSAAVFLGGSLGLPPSTLEQLDLLVPIVGAVLDDRDELAPVVAIHVKDGARFLELATSGTPRFSKGGGDGGVVSLVPAASEKSLSYAVAGNYLVLARDEALILRAAPFLTRTVASRARPEEDMVATASHAALAGPIALRLKKMWDSWKGDREAEDAALRAKHGGSAPDFGDPAQALADVDAKAAHFFAILGDLEEARVSLTLEPKSAETGPEYHVAVTMKPASRSGAAAEEVRAMPVDSAEPLLSLPASVGVGLLTRDTAELRQQSSVAQVDAIEKVLGSRLETDDKTKIANAFQSWSKGRGDWLTAGLLWAGPSRAAVLRTAVADPAELGRGATAMLKLLSVRAIASPLSTWVGDMKISGPGATADGVVQTVHVVRRPPKSEQRRDKPAQSDAFDIVWSVDKDLFLGAAGTDAKSAFASLQKADAGKTLADDPYLARNVKRLGPNVSFAIIVDTGKVGERAVQAGTLGSAFFLAYGKSRENQAWLELDAPASVVASYASLLGSLR